MAQPDLDLGYVRVMLLGVGRGGCSEPVHTQPLDLDAGGVCPLGNYCINPVRVATGAGGGSKNRAKQLAMPGLAFIVPFQVIVKTLGRNRVQR